MCCDAHRGFAGNRTEGHPPVEVSAYGRFEEDHNAPLIVCTIAASAAERCQCTGYDIRMMVTDTPEGTARYIEENSCKCERKIDGEDLKCALCRVWCADEMVVQSNYGRKVLAEAFPTVEETFQTAS